MKTKNCVRLVNIMIRRTQLVSDAFIHALPVALREYADAIESGGHDKTPDDFWSGNGCHIQLIAGSYDPTDS